MSQSMDSNLGNQMAKKRELKKKPKTPNQNQ